MERSIRRDNIILVVLIVIAIWLVTEALKLDISFGEGDIGPGGLPLLIFGAIAAGSGILLIRNLLVFLRRADDLSIHRQEVRGGDTDSQSSERLAFKIVTLTAIYVFLTPLLGFLLTTPPFLLAVYLLIGGQHYRTTSRVVMIGAAFAVLAAILLTLIFVALLDVPLPIWPRFLDV